MNEIEVLKLTDDNGKIQFYEITPLQKRVLEVLPCYNNDDELGMAYLDACYALEDGEIEEMPFLTPLARKLRVNRSTLVNAICRKNGSRLSLEEMGIVRAMTPSAPNSSALVNYYYKTQKEVITLQSINEVPKIKNREEMTPGYSDWRKEVLIRDEVCQCCGLDKHLQVHHLFGYKEHPELATVEENGVTLCKFCHDKYHSIYGLKNINPLDFMEFMDRFKVKQ